MVGHKHVSQFVELLVDEKLLLGAHQLRPQRAVRLRLKLLKVLGELVVDSDTLFN